MSDWEPSQQASRAAWKDRYRYQIDRDRENTERRDQARQAYRDALQADCVHGPRKRKIGDQDGRPVAMLVCRLDSPACGISYVPADMVYRQWRDGQPDTAGS
jgi:hypothetical protein